MARHDHELRLAGALLHVVQEVDAGRAREHQVRQDEVERRDVRAVEEELRIGIRLERDVRVLEDRGDELEDTEVVVDGGDAERDFLHSASDLESTNRRILREHMPVSLPLVLLVEADPDRRRAMSELFARERFEVLGVARPEAAQSATVVSPRLVALSLLESGERLLPYVAAWRSDPERARVPLLAIVRTEDEALA